jgi:hypothetical protein
MLGVGSLREVQAGGNLNSSFRAVLVRDPRNQPRAKEKAPSPYPDSCPFPVYPNTHLPPGRRQAANLV